MDAIAGLSLKVDHLGQQHSTMERFVFEDCNVRTAVMAMKEARNIFQLVDASELLEFFYDDKSETAILRCLACFKLHLASKPTLNSLTPFQAQRILNSSSMTSNGTLGSGIILKQETTRLLVNGQNQTWYRQKRACIDHLCLLGDGSKLRKNAMEMYRCENKINEKKASAATNIFRAAISDLKLGTAAIHFETLLSLLACCSVDVGNIGHSHKNFNFSTCGRSDVTCPITRYSNLETKAVVAKGESKLTKAASGCATAFKRLEKAGDSILPGGSYKGVPLLEGWLVTNIAQNEATAQRPDSRFTWEMREEIDVKEDHKRLASDILMALDTRVNSVVSDGSLAVLQAFVAEALVKLHCGSASNKTVKLDVSDGDYDVYGVKECEAVLAVASKMPGIRASGMDFDPKLGHRYMARIKDAVMAGIWETLCPEWFVSQDKHATPLQSQDSDLVLFQSVSSDTLDALFRLKFANGKEFYQCLGRVS